MTGTTRWRWIAWSTPAATFARGRGRITAPGMVTVTGPDGSITSYVARRGIVLNTGTFPAAPPVPGLAETPYSTNRDMVALTELPASLAILGGGAIGCELAQVFATFGVEVTVVEASPRILAMEEPEASAAVQRAFDAAGITVLAGARAQQVEHGPNGFRVVLADGTVTAEQLLVAAGRRNNLQDLGLEHRRSRPRGAGARPGRADAGGRGCLGDRRHHRQRRRSPTCRCTRRTW